MMDGCVVGQQPQTYFTWLLSNVQSIRDRASKKQSQPVSEIG